MGVKVIEMHSGSEIELNPGNLTEVSSGNTVEMSQGNTAETPRSGGERVSWNEKSKAYYRERTQKNACICIFVSTIFIGYVFLPFLSPILFNPTSDLLSYGAPSVGAKLENLPNDANNGLLSWTPIGIALGLEILLHFVMSFTLLRSTLPDMEPITGFLCTRLWVKINSFLLIFDIYFFFFHLGWYIFGATIVLTRICITAEVDWYSMTLEKDNETPRSRARTETTSVV